MERVQGRDIFHSGDIFCKTHKKSGKSRKNKSIKCIKLADITKYPSLLKKNKSTCARRRTAHYISYTRAVIIQYITQDMRT